MSGSKDKQLPTIELTRIIPALAEANAMKGEDEPMPKACFMMVDRCIQLKGREYVLLKESTGPSSKRFTPPQVFWKTAPTPKHSFNLFARVSSVGCSDMENKAAALAIADMLRRRQLVCKGVPVREWGLCKTTITNGLLSLVYKWDLSRPQTEWDFESQQSQHNFLYFVVGINQLDPQPITMLYDLSAIQYGVMEIGHEHRMPIPYVFAERTSCVDSYPHIYAETELWKDSKQIDSELYSVEELVRSGLFPIPSHVDPEQSRKSIQLLQNFSKFQSALLAVCEEQSQVEQQQTFQRS